MTGSRWTCPFPMTTSASRSAAVDVRVPGDKSLTHRALILASLAEGESRLRGCLDAADTRSTAAVLRALGCGIPPWPTDRRQGASGEIRVAGRGLRGWRRPDTALDCGNSGTTARLVLGALAGCPFDAVMTGDESLQARPMRRVTAPLAETGARFEELGDGDGLPVRVTGARPLRPVVHDGPRASAQVKSALVLAGLTGGAPVRVTEPALSRDHTERMLTAMGVRVRVSERAGSGGGVAVELDPVERLEPLDLVVPGDPSSAAFFVGLGTLLGTVRAVDVGLNATRTGFVAVLRRMGARVEVEPGRPSGGEPIGDLMATPGPLRGATVEAAEVPSLLDEIPLLAALAAVADGETRFEGVRELRVKETDRVAALVENLRALGVETEDGPGHLVVRGRTGPLRGTVRSFGDHRVAMAFGILGAIPGNDIQVEGGNAVEISYPGFWQELERVRKELRGT